MTEQQPDWRKWYFHFGVELRQHGSQLIGTCPWCGKDDHYYVGPLNGIGTCQRGATDLCSGNTNHYSFMQKLLSVSLEETSEQSYSELSENRGIKEKTLTHFGLAQNILNDNWLIPTYNEKGKLTNLYQATEREINKNGDLPGYDIRSSPYPCSHGLFNAQTIKRQKTIYLVEGHWDLLVLVEIFAHLQRSGDRLIRMGRPNWKNDLLKSCAIVAVPGANVFKDSWFKFFKGKDLIILGDNDDAGKQMTKRVVEKLMESNQQPKGISHMVWNLNLPEPLLVKEVVR